MVYLLLFFASFLAATIFPLSSEAALFAALQSGANKTFLLVSASAGNVLAIVLNYYLGYFLYEKTKKKLLASKTGKKAYILLHRYGYAALLFSWLPVIGDPITLVAGVARLRFDVFLLVAGGLRIVRYYVIVTLQ